MKKNYSEDDIKTVKTLTEKNIDFIVNFYPNIPQVNRKIHEQRNKLVEYKSDYPVAINKTLNLEMLNTIAGQYRLGNNQFHPGLTENEFLSWMDDLLLRVNIIPEKLIMAQAIIESGWGSSKYAKSINNYLGIQCHKAGCGQPPSRIENPKFWVKSFPDIQTCIEEYLWTLNADFAYNELREIRRTLQKGGEPLNALVLAHGLERYSEKGGEYVVLVRTIIKNYLPRDLEAFIYHQKNKDPT